MKIVKFQRHPDDTEKVIIHFEDSSSVEVADKHYRQALEDAGKLED